MNNEQITKAIERFKNEGVRVRDIAYILLAKMFSDKKVAYKCLFDGKDDGYDTYVNDDLRQRLEQYMTEEGFLRSVSTDSDDGSITFEENKAALTKMISDIEEDMADGVIEKKDGYARIVDIRTKLNDKFKVEAEKRDRLIVVEKKFDFVCPHTHRECYQLNKEDAKAKFNLIDNPNISAED